MTIRITKSLTLTVFSLGGYNFFWEFLGRFQSDDNDHDSSDDSDYDRSDNNDNKIDNKDNKVTNIHSF